MLEVNPFFVSKIIYRDVNQIVQGGALHERKKSSSNFTPYSSGDKFRSLEELEAGEISNLVLDLKARPINVYVRPQ